MGLRDKLTESEWPTDKMKEYYVEKYGKWQNS